MEFLLHLLGSGGGGRCGSGFSEGGELKWSGARVSMWQLGIMDLKGVSGTPLI